MSCPDSIRQLIAKFSEQSDQYRSADYNETQVRIDFINPMFKALGWDMDNIAGYAEPYREVVHEDAIRIEGNTKAPDYSFRVGGVRKFFLEAKRPSVNIRDSVEPAYQLRRYAWTAKLPLSILTDFEEFAVYDTRKPPKHLDKASNARISYFTYLEYPDKWEEIAGVFSKEAILKGAFDRYVDSKGKAGTSEFDDEFLTEIEQWRTKLAQNLALRNDSLSASDLNFAVQRIIDRVIFLRICEARGTESFGQLQALLSGDQTYARSLALFRAADDRYNSGLFHFSREPSRREQPDEVTPALDVDDQTLKSIVRRLYYPESPYAFSAMAPEILGNVYERFLGRVIELTPAHRAKIEPKPEVRKAGGVFYTPIYVVDYIVKSAVGKLLTGKTPREAAKIKIVDPACGSGSFLLGAYQYLLDWHHEWYLNDGPEKWLKGRDGALRPGPGGHPRLTGKMRKQILLNNIHGVDIDHQAVEVTKLSLLLKVLEGETTESADASTKLFHDRALPDLRDNLKCGNSLVGTDIFAPPDDWSPAERRQINAFDWKDEFKSVFRQGGFDAVLGNPPYVRTEGIAPIKKYLAKRYLVHDERTDLYAYFVEAGLKLLRPHGIFSMIISNKFVRAEYGANLRRLISGESGIDSVADLAGVPVFQGATVRTLILSATKSIQSHTTRYCPPPNPENFRSIVAGNVSLDSYVRSDGFPIAALSSETGGWSFSRNGAQGVMDKLRTSGVTLGEWLSQPICYGVKSGLVEAFVIDREQSDKLRVGSSKCKKIIRPYITGREIRRYAPVGGTTQLIYTHHGVDVTGCKAILNHLRKYRDKLIARATKQRWYELQQPQERYVSLMSQPKIVYPDISKGCRFAIDVGNHVCGDTSFAIPVDDRVLLGILNSRVAFFYFRLTCAELESHEESYLRFKLQYVSRFPLPKGFIDPKRNSGTKSMLTLIDSMLSLNEAIAGERSPHGKDALSREIAAIDRRIDTLVYELYGLTDDEIQIIEEGSK